MIDYIDEIQERLGSIDKLPSFPFKCCCEYAIFPALGDDFVCKKLYKVLFEENKNFGNKIFIAKSVLDIKGKETSLLMQKEKNWKEFEGFQNSSLVYEGFYLTGENFNWLGIYHPDDYVIVGGDDGFVSSICRILYAGKDWRVAFEQAFKDGKIDMYKKDFEELQKELF